MIRIETKRGTGEHEGAWLLLAHRNGYRSGNGGLGALYEGRPCMTARRAFRAAAASVFARWVGPARWIA